MADTPDIPSCAAPRCPRIRITRAVTIPDEVRLARYLRAPELGPSVLFFSGGTALKALSQRIIDYTHNSIHLITPFDSGGSSAKIRDAFQMLAVGDLRNRIMALADRSIKGAPEIYDLFAHRFPKVPQSPDVDIQAELRNQLEAMIRGRHPLVARVPDPMRKIIRAHLGFFREHMEPDFDLRGASIGNLILTGGYFNYGRRIDPVIYLFSRLVEARGTVRPVLNKDLHLVSELADGTTLVGQHLLTGKEAQPIPSPVKRVYLSRKRTEPEAVEVRIRDKVAELIHSADIICYPMGSFYSSLVANLLPKGVGQAVSQTQCPKIYIPNQGMDPELLGLPLLGQVQALFHYLEQGVDKPLPRESLLNFVLLDSVNGSYGPLADLDKLKRYGVEVIDAQLISDRSRPYLDEDLVLRHLLSLV